MKHVACRVKIGKNGRKYNLIRNALQEGDRGAARGHEEIRRPEQAAGTVRGGTVVQSLIPYGRSRSIDILKLEESYDQCNEQEVREGETVEYGSRCIDG